MATRTATRRLCFGCAAALLAGVGAAVFVSSRVQAGDGDPPATIELTGTVRDFREWGVEDGHPDFERMPEHGLGRYGGNVAGLLGPDGSPVFTGDGAKITQQWRDAEHRAICYCLYDETLGDIEGQFGIAGTGGIMSAQTFGQWYDDVLGTNMSMPLMITLVRQPDGMYVFDDQVDPYYSDLGGFFPIDDQLYGNSAGNAGHNYHFTFELHAEFTYEDDLDLNFRFVGDDDVRVFIDGRLVIDLSGVHAAHDQYVDLDRLGLEDDERYPLDFYFAQRFKPHSRFRIETNIPLEGDSVVSVNGLFD